MADEWMTIPIAEFPEYLIPREETGKRGRPRHDDPTRSVYGVSEVKAMLAVIPAEDRDLWLNVGIILGRTFQCCDEAWQLYNEWADKYEGERGKGHDARMRQAFYETSQESADRELSLGTIIKLAMDHGWVPTTGRIPLEAFYFHLGQGFLYRPTMQICSAKDVDIAVSPRMDDGVMRKASEIIQRRRLVTCMTSHPQLDEYTPEMNLVKGELVADPGAAILNLYRHASIELGAAKLAKPFLDHCDKVFNKPGDRDQFLDFMAHRVQKPWEKIRFALLIGGEQGTGKDTAIEMCLDAMGRWNVENIGPRALKTDFNAYLVCALLRVNEAADAQDQSRWMLNEQLKNIIAGTPDHATINGKYQVTQHIRLYCAVVITTNHLLDSVHIPPDDRRYDIIEGATLEEMGLRASEQKQEEVKAIADLSGKDAQAAVTALEEQYAKKRRTYFDDLWAWFYEQGGARHVAAFLHARDLSKFSAALGQRKTAAHKEVVQHGMIGDEWLRDLVDGLNNPDVLRTDWLMERAVRAGEKKETVRAKMGHGLKRMGYEVVMNPHVQDGRWQVQGVKCKVYKKRGYKFEGDWQKHLEIPKA